MTEFFLPIIPPTTTHQQKRAAVKNGKPVFYEDNELKAARQKLSDHVGPLRPTVPYTSAIRLVTKWLFPCGSSHKDGEYRATRPDTDNLQKLLKDVMTDNHFWTDDSLVASEVIEKFWAAHPGIYICIEELES